MFFAYPCESALVWVDFSPVHPCRGDFERAAWLLNQGSSLRRRFFPRKRLFKDEGDKTNGLTSPHKDASILTKTVSQIKGSMVLPPWLLVGPQLEPTSSNLADRCSLSWVNGGVGGVGDRGHQIYIINNYRISSRGAWITIGFFSHSFQISSRFWLASIPRLILHNQLAFTMFGRSKQYHRFDGNHRSASFPRAAA